MKRLSALSALLPGLVLLTGIGQSYALSVHEVSKSEVAETCAKYENCTTYPAKNGGPTQVSPEGGGWTAYCGGYGAGNANTCTVVIFVAKHVSTGSRPSLPAVALSIAPTLSGGSGGGTTGPHLGTANGQSSSGNTQIRGR